MWHFHTNFWMQHEAHSASTIGRNHHTYMCTSMADRQKLTKTMVSLPLLALPGSKVKTALIGGASLGWFSQAGMRGSPSPISPSSQLDKCCHWPPCWKDLKEEAAEGEGESTGSSSNTTTSLTSGHSLFFFIPPHPDIGLAVDSSIQPGDWSDKIN